MAKLQLKLETLEVESFDTGREGAEVRGTVQGNAVVGPQITAEATCRCPEGQSYWCPWSDAC